MAHVTLSTAAWTPTQTDAFAARSDVRDLLIVEHPWVPSTADGYGQWETVVSPPPDWRPGDPLYVSFYQSDNYSGGWGPSAWLGTQAFIGHRFKQLLVNGEVVWESDVADEEWGGTPADNYHPPADVPAISDAYRRVDISAHAAAQMTLTLRVIDRVASTEALPGDTYRRFDWSQHDPHVAALNFHTVAFFGDVALTTDPQVVRPERVPPAARESTQGGALPARIPLALAGPETLPPPGFPLRCGVPLPRGAAPAGHPFGLHDEAGRAVPLAVTETSHWPDGTIRWLLLEFVATGCGQHALIPGEPPAAPPSPVCVTETRLDNGLVAIELGGAQGDGVLESITRKSLRLGPMDLSVKLNRVGWRDRFAARRLRVTVERDNGVCATVRVDGEMVSAEGTRFGPWRARLSLWAGLPYLLAEWTLTSESDQSMAMLLDWSARVKLPDLTDATVDFGEFEPGYDRADIGVKGMGHFGTFSTPRALPLYADSEVSCRQEQVDQARLYRNTSWSATAPHAAGFANLTHPDGGLVASMRWFAEEFPSGLILRPDELRLATMPESEGALGWPHDRPFARMGRGESKRQTFALWLHDGALPADQAEAFNACVQDAPHLLDREWFVACDVLEAGPPRESPALAGWYETVEPIIEWTGIAAPRPGLREYWDTCWSNDYRGRVHLGLLQYLETGDLRWHRYFDASATHTRDVDIIHHCPEHPEWVGATHSYGEDHTTCGPMSNIGLNVDSLLDHYLMTGDPDSLEAARGLAEHILTCRPVRCARETGWPLSQLVRWYEQSGDERFLKKANEFLAAAQRYTEPRRGVLAEIHGSWSYRGPVSFMTGYLAFGLIRHHQLTRDPSTLDLLCRLADGAVGERSPVPGRFRYSPLPENNREPHLRGHNSLMAGIFGYLALATDEERYVRWTRECYEEMVRPGEESPASMDMLQTAGWILRAVAGADAEP
jgi:hypothetical protein